MSREVDHYIWTAYVAVQYEGEQNRDFFTNKEDAFDHLRSFMGDDIAFAKNPHNEDVWNVNYSSSRTGVVAKKPVWESIDES